MKFHSIKVGDKAEIKHKITEVDITRFVDLTGDDNKMHTDKEFTANTSYKKPVIHGMLGASFISTVIGTKLPGDGALWYSQNLEFLLPVRVGDTLKISVTVIKKFNSTKTIELQTDIYNQNRQQVTTGTARVKIVEQKKYPGKKLKNDSKSVLVIGGTGGIGSATCLQLSEEGFDVAIHYYNNSKKAEKLRKEIIKNGQKSVVVSGDLYDLDNIKDLKLQSERGIGKISVIINCATIPIHTVKFDNLEWYDIQEQFDINVKCSYNLIKIF